MLAKTASFFKKKGETTYDESNLELKIEKQCFVGRSASVSLVYQSGNPKDKPQTVPFKCSWYIRTISQLKQVGSAPTYTPNFSNVGAVLTCQVEPAVEGKNYEGMPLMAQAGVVLIPHSLLQLLDRHINTTFIAKGKVQGSQSQVQLTPSGMRVQGAVIMERTDYPNVGFISPRQVLIQTKDKSFQFQSEDAELLWALSRCHRGLAQARKQSLIFYDRMTAGTCLQLDFLFEQAKREQRRAKELEVKLAGQIQQKQRFKSKEEVARQNLSACTKNYYQLDKQNKKLEKKVEASLEHTNFLENEVKFLNMELQKLKSREETGGEQNGTCETPQSSAQVTKLLQQNSNLLNSIREERDFLQRRVEQLEQQLRSAGKVKDSALAQTKRLRNCINDLEREKQVMGRVQKGLQQQVRKEVQAKDREKRKKFQKEASKKGASFDASQNEQLKKLANKLTELCTDKDQQIASLKSINKQLAIRLDKLEQVA